MFIEFDGGYDGGRCAILPSAVTAFCCHPDSPNRTKIMLSGGDCVLVDHDFNTVLDRFGLFYSGDE